MSDDLETAAAAGDADAMVELAGVLEARADALYSRSREWLLRASNVGSLDGWHGCVRWAAVEREYDRAAMMLRTIERLFPDVPPERWVSVAPDVLGRDLPLDSDGVSDVSGAGTFTVITPYGRRAAEALAPVVDRLLGVDEHGVEHSPDEIFIDGVDPPYTPNDVDDLHWTHYAVQITLDTKGEMTAAMGRMIVNLLVGWLAEARLPAHVTGYRPDLHRRLSIYTSGDG